ncbi:DUF4190 domain-containing protein [Streptomyces sp. NPDC051597]|uniref:DUF4190 domain-containing protein n=1 Tax=Streptomyces sp. NPDC051597 TaxID=3155049 RepID=UPI00343A76F1
MSDNRDQSSEGAEPVDPWAPPEQKVPLSKPVHDQPTVTSMPAAGPPPAAGPVPPPPTAPGGPGAPGGYGYPAYPAYTGYPGYGHPGHPGHPGWTGMAAPLNGFGTTALVLGILSVVLFCLWGLGIVLGILALIFGFLGRGRAKRGEATNGAQALAGIILGAVGVVVSAVFLGLMIWAVTNDEDGDDSTRYDDPFATTLILRDSPTPPLP